MWTFSPRAISSRNAPSGNRLDSTGCSFTFLVHGSDRFFFGLRKRWMSGQAERGTFRIAGVLVGEPQGVAAVAEPGQMADQPTVQRQLEDADFFLTSAD